jgi:hypothetical protein
MDNPEKLATLGTQDEDKQEWTIQRNTQYLVHKTKKNKNGHNVACISGLSILVFLRLVYPMLQVSLDGPFLFFFVLCTQCCKLLWIVYSCFSSSVHKRKKNKNGKSRETCNIGYTRRRQTRMDNPEKLVTLGTQDQDKQELTIQRNL